MVSRSALLLPGFALALASSLLLPRAARADVPQTDIDACAGKAKDDLCEDNGPGTCQPRKCDKLDYSKGVPPTMREWDCNKCIPGRPKSDVAPAPAAATPGVPAPAPKSAANSGCAIAGDSGGLSLLVLLAIGGWRRRSGGLARHPR